MFAKLHELLGGTSPITGYIGSSIIALDLAQSIFIQGGVPQDAGGWFYFAMALVTGLGVRFSKDANKSHAPVPKAEPLTVEQKP